MAEKVKRQLIQPAVVPLLATALAAVLIITIGETLLALFEPGTPELERVELWFGVALSLAILGVAALANARPRSGAMLDRPVAIGSQGMFEPGLPPVADAARNGPLGTVADITEGDTLYARSGALARVRGLIPGGEEHGIRYKGYIYAQGLYGASDELWIPVEAVATVYPETHAVFLAIKGDETETFGWNRPPAHFRRTERPPEPPKAL